VRYRGTQTLRRYDFTGEFVIVQEMTIKRYFILHEKPNPSTDYFVAPYIKQIQTSGTPVIQYAWGDSLDEQALDGACVVLVRYVTSAWKRQLSKHRARLHSLVYFMDDDIPDRTASQGLPLKYRFKLYRHGQRHLPWLVAQEAKFWVSTAYLRDKYPHYQCLQIDPTPLPLPEHRCRVFYHATASHRAEIAWLHGVMKAVLQKNPLIDFEIIGDRDTLAMYRSLPRTTVVHPMSWPAYQSFLAIPGRNIGLAPFVPSAFNAARSYTKWLDIQRAGAFALLASDGPWADLPLNDDRACLVPMDPKQWVNQILSHSKRIIEAKHLA